MANNSISKVLKIFYPVGDDLKEMVEANPNAAVLSILIPSFFSLFCLTLNGFVDSIFVAECGSTSLIGVGVIQSIFVIVVGIGTGLSVATNSSLSYTIGKYSRGENARRIIDNSIILTLIIGIVSSVILVTFLKPILLLLNIGNALDPALTYGTVLFSGNIFFFFAAVIPSILKAEGEVVKATVSFISTSILNIFLDYLLINVLGYGVFGAACATTFCSALCCLLLVYFMVKSEKINISPNIFSDVDFGVMKKIFIDSIPVAFECGVLSLFSFFANMLFNFFTNPADFAAFIASYKVYNMAIIPAIALAEANVTVVAYLYGIGDFDTMNDLLKYEFKLITIVMVALFALITLFRTPIAYIYSISNPQALISSVEMALPLLNIILVIMPFGILSVSVLQGVQAYRESFIVSSIRSIALEIVLGFIFAYVMGNTFGIYIGFIIGAILGCILSFYITEKIILKKKEENAEVS